MTRGFRDEGFRRSADDDEATEVTIEGVIVLSETEAAIKCQIGKRAVWVPKSQITDDSEVYEADQCGKLVVTAWFAEKEDLS